MEIIKEQLVILELIVEIWEELVPDVTVEGKEGLDSLELIVDT